jgi:peptidoglycan lytic transglycosylase
MRRRRPPSIRVNAPPRERYPGFLWVAVPALLVYLGIVIAAPPEPTRAPLLPAPGSGLAGEASWYGAELHGSPTASGEPFDMYALTAAHRTLPLGSLALVRNPDNGREVVVRINDRGPASHRLAIDLSYAAARALGFLDGGPRRVEIVPLP